MAKGLEKQLKGLLDSVDQLLTPEIMAQMTPEQITEYNKAKNCDIMTGNLDKRIEELQKIARYGV